MSCASENLLTCIRKDAECLSLCSFCVIAMQGSGPRSVEQGDNNAFESLTVREGRSEQACA